MSIQSMENMEIQIKKLYKNWELYFRENWRWKVNNLTVFQGHFWVDFDSNS
jgi:hypothetical protein